jgi:hypothetical protein
MGLAWDSIEFTTVAANFRLGIGVTSSGGLVLLMLALACWRSSDAVPDVPGPRTLTEVAKAARELGLYYFSDRPDGRFEGGISKRLVLSDRPLNYQRVTSLRFDAGHRCWDGTVAVTLDPFHGYDDYFDSTDGQSPSGVARWGDLFLLGDPALIRRLMEHARL